MNPVLEARGACISRDGSVVLEAFDGASRGERIYCSGNFEALWGLVTEPRSRFRGETTFELSRGSLHILGRDVAEGAHEKLVGVAPLDPPLPETFSVLQYATASARLGGLRKPDAVASAHLALNRVGMSSAAARPLRSLHVAERRALVLAHAIVLSPHVLLAEAPLRGLSGNALDFVVRAMDGACEGRASILFMDHAVPRSPESRALSGSSDLLLVKQTSVHYFGAPKALSTHEATYSLLILSNAEAMSRKLEESDIALRGGPFRYFASLPRDRSSRDILKAARETDSALVELVPLIE